MTKLHDLIRERAPIEKIKADLCANLKDLTHYVCLPEELCKGGRSALHEAAYWGDLECMQLLIDAGAKLNASTVSGYTALHISVLNRYYDCVKLLVHNGVNIDARTKRGKTALVIAVEGNNVISAQFLLDAGADICTIDMNNDTLLHHAARENSIECLELLLDRGGINTSAVNCEGETALDIASCSFNDHEECAELLGYTTEDNYLMFNGKKYKLTETN